MRFKAAANGGVASPAAYVLLGFINAGSRLVSCYGEDLSSGGKLLRRLPLDA